MKASEEATERLLAFIESSATDAADSALLDAAKAELMAISGQDFGSSIDDWMDWYTNAVGKPPEPLLIAQQMYKTRVMLRTLKQKHDQ